ncbi:DUF1016 domain-containing protein [Sesbania bispinosa]|nr:DUF1016 domain-containing protein [Sesbania bispinosa]
MKAATWVAYAEGFGAIQSRVGCRQVAAHSSKKESSLLAWAVGSDLFRYIYEIKYREKGLRKKGKIL